MVEHALEERGVVSSILTFGTKNNMINFFTTRFQTITDYFSTQSLSFEKFTNLFSWDFWTESFIGPTSEYTVLVLLFVALVIVGLFVWKKALKKRQLEAPVYDWEINQIINIIIFVIIMTFSYIFFRSQELPYLSSRSIVLISFVVTGLWAVWIIARINKKIRNERVAYLEKERFSRYIPKKKKARN